MTFSKKSVLAIGLASLGSASADQPPLRGGGGSGGCPTTQSGMWGGQGLYCLDNGGGVIGYGGGGGSSGNLYTCTTPGGHAQLAQTCANGCVKAPAGRADYCRDFNPIPPAVCPVGYSWGGQGNYCFGNTLYHCYQPGQTAQFVQNCPRGCIHNNPGTPDYCY